MQSLSDNNQTNNIEAFNSTSRYLDDLLNIDNPYFKQMVGQIYPTELQLNKANSSDTEAPFLDLNLSIINDIVCSKIYDKQDDFSFEIVNFRFLDEDVPRSLSYGIYTETIKLRPLDVYVCQFLMYERISFKFLHYNLISFGNVMHLNEIHLMISRAADNSENTSTLKIKSHNINSLCVHHNSEKFKRIKHH